MHPILSERRIFLLYITAWLVAGGLLAALLNTTGMSILSAVVLAIPMTLVLSFMCLASYYLCKTFPLRRLPAAEDPMRQSGVNIARLLVIHSIAAALTSSVWISLGNTWVSFISEIPLIGPLAEQYTLQIPLLFTVGGTLFLLSTAIHYAIIAFGESREAERNAMELRLLAQEAELRALRSQINPHFLFNSLNSISALTTHDPAGARSMTLKLADFLRKTISLGSRSQVTLHEELELTRGFLAIEQIRFGPRLTLDESISADTLSCIVPPLILQPLVENAIGHGIGQLLEGGTITVAAERTGTRLKISIRNPVDPERKPHRGHGIGLQNVRNRLEAVYQNDASLELQSDDSMFVVEIVLPVKIGILEDHAESLVREH
ncbi:MAG: histidine kinase [Bacteroidota bacterium]